METCKGAKPAGLGVRQVYPALAYSICLFHTCTRRMQIKSKLVFTFFFLLAQIQVSSERETLHAYWCVCRHIAILDSRGLGLKCDTRTSHYSSTGAVKCLLNKGWFKNMLVHIVKVGPRCVGQRTALKCWDTSLN